MTNELKNQTPYLAGKDLKKAAEKLINILSFRTGGNTFLLDKKFTDIQFFANLKSLMIELRSQYVIEYVSTNSERTSAPRKLRVEVANGPKGEKRQGFIRESFIVPKNLGGN